MKSSISAAKLTFNIELVWQQWARKCGDYFDVNSFCDLISSHEPFGSTEKGKVSTDLPSFYDHSNAGPHKNHPARVLIVVDEIEEDNDLHEYVGNYLLWR